MIHQGTLVQSEHAKAIKSERLAVGEYKEIIHLHLQKNAVLEEHLSQTNAVLFIVSGELDYITHDKRYKLESGDYLTFDAHVLHALEAFEDTHALLIK